MEGKFLCFVSILSVPNLFYASTVPELEANCDSTPRLEVFYSPSTEITCSRPYDLTSLTESGEPQVAFSSAKEDDYYTLIMADPDAPSADSPRVRYWLHWLVTNIKGKDLIQHGTMRGDLVVEYEGPSPPAGSGYHRYFFYLFKQTHLLTIIPEPPRARFDGAEFAMVNGLDFSPVALNMFYTHRD